jgi:CRISPR type IV-associated protein Csf2
MTVRNKIEGILRLTTPMHCAAGSAKIDGRNVTQTMTQSVFTAEGRQYVPYFPGNDVRGRVRRFAARILLDRITASNKIKRELYSGSDVGGWNPHNRTPRP